MKVRDKIPAISKVRAVPFTVFATVGVINAMNMTDGIDGLVGNMTMLSGEDFTSEDSQRTTTLLKEISATADSLNAGCIFLSTT